MVILLMVSMSIPIIKGSVKDLIVSIVIELNKAMLKKIKWCLLLIIEPENNWILFTSIKKNFAHMYRVYYDNGI